MKKHFILLGKPGIIYFCWLFIILFVGLIFGYEGTAKVNWPALILVLLFFFILIYTYLFSYYTKNTLKLPYRKIIKVPIQIQILGNWKCFVLEKIAIDPTQTFYLLRLRKIKK